MRPLSRALAILAVALTVVACSGGASPAVSEVPASQTPASAPPASTPPTQAPVSQAPAGACTTTADAAAVSVTIAGFAFDPDPVSAKVGQVIGWTNQDGAPHSATLDSGECRTPNLGKGDSAGLVFSQAGTFKYFCSVHGKASMSGTIVIEP